MSTTAFDPTNGGTGDSGSPTTTSSGPVTTEMTSADSTGQPPGGSCCQVSPAAGCGNAEIETCVCTIEPSCCQEVWSQQCVDLAGLPCDDPGCSEPPPATSTGSTESTGGSESSGEPPPMLTCDELAAQEGWKNVRCEAGGGSQCNGMGTPTTDCNFCCEVCGEPGDLSCGDLSTMQGWAEAYCEWNGNNACGGVGTPTCDCDVCCEVG